MTMDWSLGVVLSSIMIFLAAVVVTHVVIMVDTIFYSSFYSSSEELERKKAHMKEAEKLMKSRKYNSTHVHIKKNKKKKIGNDTDASVKKRDAAARVPESRFKDGSVITYGFGNFSYVEYGEEKKSIVREALGRAAESWKIETDRRNIQFKEILDVHSCNFVMKVLCLGSKRLGLDRAAFAPGGDKAGEAKEIFIFPSFFWGKTNKTFSLRAELEYILGVDVDEND